MISRLRGIIVAKQAPELLIEVNGLGYEVQASMNTFYRLPDIGQEVVLHTHFVVREDAQQLYGFGELHERALFRSLLKVNGIGPKVALAILSSIEADDFVRCVADQNSTALQRLPGIGKKTAERLIIEMRDRLADWQMPEHLSAKSITENKLIKSTQAAEQEAVSALIALGYKPQEASRAVMQITDKNLSSEDLIRRALKNMNSRN